MMKFKKSHVHICCLVAGDDNLGYALMRVA